MEISMGSADRSEDILKPMLSLSSPCHLEQVRVYTLNIPLKNQNILYKQQNNSVGVSTSYIPGQKLTLSMKPPCHGQKGSLFAWLTVSIWK